MILATDFRNSGGSNSRGESILVPCRNFTWITLKPPAVDNSGGVPLPDKAEAYKDSSTSAMGASTDLPFPEADFSKTARLSENIGTTHFADKLELCQSASMSASRVKEWKNLRNGLAIFMHPSEERLSSTECEIEEWKKCRELLVKNEQKASKRSH